MWFQNRNAYTCVYIFKYIQLCPLIPMGPHFNKSSAVITWQNANFALYCLFGRAVSTYISVSEVITVLIKYYVCKCPSCTRHQYISNHNIEAVKFASYPCLWASWESSSKKTFIGLVLENETEKQQYTFFFFIEHYVCRCPRSTCYQVISSHNNKNGSTANRYGYTHRLGLSQMKSTCV